MGKYDLDSEYDEKETYTLYDLAKVITEELRTKIREVDKNQTTDTKLNYDELSASNKDCFSQDDIYNKLAHNSHGTGMLDKLNKMLGFDIENAAKSSMREQFDMLRILKVLFCIEKDEKFKITDLLAKPRLNNIENNDPKKHKNSEIFNGLYERVKGVVDDADIRCRKINEADDFWNFITDQTFNHVLSDKAIHSPEDSKIELLRLKDLLQNKIYSKLKDIPPSKKHHHEGGMKTFFNILACHRYLCLENAKITLNLNTETGISPDSEYVKNFIKLEQHPRIPFEKLQSLSLRLDNKNDEKEWDEFMDLLSYSVKIQDEEINDYHYTVKYAPTVIKWWYSYYCLQQEEMVSLDLY